MSPFWLSLLSIALSCLAADAIQWVVLILTSGYPWVQLVSAFLGWHATFLYITHLFANTRSFRARYLNDMRSSRYSYSADREIFWHKEWIVVLASSILVGIFRTSWIVAWYLFPLNLLYFFFTYRLVQAFNHWNWCRERLCGLSGEESQEEHE